MRHKNSITKFGRTSSHRKAMFANMITSLFRHERITTTVDKAKVARRFAEKLITVAKKDGLHARRVANKTVRDDEVLDKLFKVIGPRYADRNGGYTRVIKLAHRIGDGADMAYLELVDRIAPSPEKEEKKKERKQARKAKKEAEAKAAEEQAEEEKAAPEPEAEVEAKAETAEPEEAASEEEHHEKEDSEGAK